MHRVSAQRTRRLQRRLSQARREAPQRDSGKHLPATIIFDDPFAFDPADGRQLAKHFLAAKRVAKDATTRCEIVLLCVAWEPADADRHEVFGRHRPKLRELADALPDDDVTLLPMTYHGLWNHWDSSEHPVLRRHTRSEPVKSNETRRDGI